MFDTITYEGHRILPITSDIVFKAIFADEKNKELLFSLLKAYLEIPAASPDDIKIVSPEKNKRFYDDKLFRLDIRIVTAQGEHIDVEIQMRDEKNMVKRSLFYASTLYAEQMRESMGYSELGRAVALNILCYTTDKDSEFIRSWRLYDTQSRQEATDALELVFVELPHAQVTELTSLRDKWTALLTAESEEDLNRLMRTDQIFEKVVETLVYVSEQEKVRFAFDQRRKATFDAAARDIDMKRYARSEGLAEGKAEGKAEGIAEGLAEGLAEGITEIVTQMVLKNYTYDQISDITGLSHEQIKNLVDDPAK